MDKPKDDEPSEWDQLVDLLHKYAAGKYARAAVGFSIKFQGDDVEHFEPLPPAVVTRSRR